MRNSSIELLRLIMMALIIVHHCIVFGLGLIDLADGNGNVMVIDNHTTMIAMLVNGLCICSVNCFVLISGYFGINVTRKKILYLIFAIGFYTLIFNVVPYILQGNIRAAIGAALFLSHSKYWFVIDYLFLMAFAPMINYAFTNMPKRYVYSFVGVLLIISVYFGFVWGHNSNFNGYTLMQFILMYCIGRIIRARATNLSVTLSAGGYFLFAGVCGALMYFLWRMGHPEMSWKVTYYNNPLIIAAAVFLFLAFKQLYFQNSMINNLSRSAIGIYLFQSSAVIGSANYALVESIRSNCENCVWGGVIC